MSGGEAVSRVANGAHKLFIGPALAKAFLRAGMGPCQGRLCGPVVTELIAEARNVAPGEVGYYRIRPPLKPITVGELLSAETN